MAGANVDTGMVASGDAGHGTAGAVVSDGGVDGRAPPAGGRGVAVEV